MTPSISKLPPILTPEGQNDPQIFKTSKTLYSFRLPDYDLYDCVNDACICSALLFEIIDKPDV